MKIKLRFILPLLVVVSLVGLLGWGLTQNPSYVPSPLINKPIPQFSLSELKKPHVSFNSQQLKQGKVTLVNVWASWCGACRSEHDTLLQIAKSGVVPIDGLNYKDTRKAALQMLDEFGNPYRVVAQDRQGKVGINWGVYGVPETYIVDGQGIIRYKQVGPITPSIWKHRLLPVIQRLQAKAKGASS